MKKREHPSAPTGAKKNEAKEEFDRSEAWEDTGKLDKNVPGRFSDDMDVADKAGTKGGVAHEGESS